MFESLFPQMHHLINELRPHQARESIRVCLQTQKEQITDVNVRLNKQITHAYEIVKTATESVQDFNSETILMETLPENFTDTPVQHSSSFSSRQDTRSDSSQFTNGLSILGRNQRSSDGEDQELSDISELTRMDALMCNLVDETIA